MLVTQESTHAGNCDDVDVHTSAARTQTNESPLLKPQRLQLACILCMCYRKHIASYIIYVAKYVAMYSVK